MTTSAAPHSLPPSPQDAIYIAGMAGQIARRGTTLPPSLLAWRDEQGGAAKVAEDLAGIDLAGRLDLDAADGLPLRLGALLHIDHTVCAAAWAGCPALVLGELDCCARLLDAFPWPDLAPLGRMMLATLPPGDLAWPLWDALAHGPGLLDPTVADHGPLPPVLSDLLLRMTGVGHA